MKKYLLLLLAIIILTGCADDDRLVIHVVDEVEMFPLDIDNQWLFLRKDIDSLGVVSDSTDSLTYTVLEQLTGDLYEYYSVEVTRTVFPNVNFIYLRNNSTGVWQLNEQDTPYTSSLILKFPTEVNDSYLWGARNVTVLAVDTVITVPAGTFECYHYFVVSGDTTLAELSSISNLFYTPDIGFISSNSFTYQNNKRIKGSFQDLDSYTLTD